MITWLDHHPGVAFLLGITLLILAIIWPALKKWSLWRSLQKEWADDPLGTLLLSVCIIGIIASIAFAATGYNPEILHISIEINGTANRN